MHCDGMVTQRRFFYTSSDHLRNSFSHIPADLLACSKCPDEIKKKLETLKGLRNKHKSQLKIGDHKLFIDRVWDRMHGPGGGIIKIPRDEETQRNSGIYNGKGDDDGSLSSVSIDSSCDHDDYQNESSDGRWLENIDIAVEQLTSALVLPYDRRLTTDYIYYSLLQISPKIMCV